MMWLDSIKKAIEKLEAINPNDEYAYERAILAYLTIKDIPILAVDIKPEVLPSLYRTRTHESPHLFEKISDVFLPPPGAVKYFARCNRPFQPVFYCSQDRETSYAELLDYWVKEKTKESDLFVTVGKWKLKNPIKVVVVTTPDPETRTSKFDKQHGKALDEFIKKQTKDNQEALVLFYRYLWEKFRKEAKDDAKTYVITTAYCNISLMYPHVKINAIYYPSVPMSKAIYSSNVERKDDGVNFAINSEFATYFNLEPLAMLHTKFSIEPLENNKFNFVDSGMMYTDRLDVFNNKIDWQEKNKCNLQNKL